MVQLEAHRCFLYTCTIGIITILGTITAVLKLALPDVQALNSPLVTDMGIVFLLHNFANMMSLNIKPCNCPNSLV